MNTVKINNPFSLINGEQLNSLEITYSTYGQVNDEKDNVIWVCHALSGNSEVHDWWAGVFGEGKTLDPTRYFIICANVLGSCYGTTGPSHSEVAESQRGIQFPLVTVEDMVNVHRLLADELGIGKIHLLIGPSLGGQQAVQWAVDEPKRFEKLVLVATNVQHSPWGIAFNESQRLALWSDETFRTNLPNGGGFGLKAARSIAMLSYRSYEGYGATQQEDFTHKVDLFRASSYQQYQGEKFVKRFDAYAYWTLSKAMDSHNVGRKYRSVVDALERISADTLVIGVDSDLLFPVTEQAFLAEHIASSHFETISSLFGHDGFLTETVLVDELMRDFVYNEFRNFRKTTFRPLKKRSV
jgi:homoserine O-acetyltransferase